MTPVRIVIEDENNFVVRVMKLPPLAPDDYHLNRWEVPLWNRYHEVRGVPESMYMGEVWFKTEGTIAVTSVPNILQNSGDARHFALALLAAADRWDELQKEKTDDKR